MLAKNLILWRCPLCFKTIYCYGNKEDQEACRVRHITNFKHQLYHI